MSTAAYSPNPPVRILIAEDSPTQAQRLRHILEQQGYEVGVAANGRLALAMAPQFAPALIITDVVMPEMDGYELSRQIKTDPKLGNTPIILVTTLSDPQDVIRGLECRADNFILKPYDERDLLARVQYVLINSEMRRAEDVGMGVTIYFNGQKHFITADRLQILNLLLSTYDAAIQRNKELNRSQEELRLLNAKLAGANKELESFSYSVSHDLRAPLRHIDGYVQMMVEDTESTLSSEAQRYLKVIADATRQMGELIDDLLAYSRMGWAELRETTVELDGLVREVIQSLEMATRGRNIIWKISPLPRVMGDPSMLKQVLANLLGNAAKYTRPRDPAHIELGCAGDEDGRNVLFVRDDGVGFDMKYADKLFGVFQRLHPAEDFEGTGVGLANVLRIVARHGGRVWAEAVPDQGATFYFTLKPAPSD
jgi:two-component system, sensor histidine kinase and response regulator